MGECLLNYCKMCKRSFTDKVKRQVKSSKRGLRRNNICEDCWPIYLKKHSMGRKYQRDRRRKIKLRMVKQLGGKCKICGYSDLSILCVFDIHHLKESKKKFDMTKVINRCGFKIFSDSEIMDELKFCIVVCANCHRKIHFKE